MEVMWVTCVVGLIPLVGWLLWWWNDIWYCHVPKFIKGGSASGVELPPGNMGVPFFGEMLRFLCYFKIYNRPDDFINSKRQKYGDGVGLYKTHMFGSPAVIAWSPMSTKFIMQSESEFILEWPTVEIVGASSIVAVQGKQHARVKSYVTRAINQPQSLRRISLMVQPRIIAALNSWCHKGTLVAYKEARKVTFENIGKYFASFEPGPILDTLDTLFVALVNGIRAYPINYPGTAYHHGVQSRKKAIEIFKKELDKKKKQRNEIDGEMTTNDLMDGLMQLKDDQGNPMSDTEVLDNIVSLVLAGYESTSLSIMWSLYYLAKYPIVLQKLREENMALSKSKNGVLITSDDIANLKYTNKVVEETIRMANVAAFSFRTATKDVVYKGYTIPKGWKVILWFRYLHTNPENFDDPMSFNPDRWNVPAKPGTYNVFGGGSRICAGNMLARLQVAVFLHYLSTGYKWELVNPNGGMTYLAHPKPVDGVEIKFSKL